MSVNQTRAVSSAHARVSNQAEDRFAMHMATATKKWTLEELHSLPDDGNKYELVRGELFVTPPPTLDHETISARLTRILVPYVAEQGLGLIYHPRAVLRFKGSEVEPDLMVRQPPAKPTTPWDKAPLPILIVEILSDSTRRRDRMQKREFYTDARVEEYWIVDGENATIASVRAGREDVLSSGELTWSPSRATVPLRIDLAQVFGFESYER
jgi:Uma2 family endonuclease